MENAESAQLPIKVWDTLVASKNTDCVSFCKVPNYEHLLLCAKYQLDPKTQIHSGGFILFDTSKNTFTNILEIETEAIFDLMWLPGLFNNKLCFLVAPISPKVQLYTYSVEENQVNMIWEKNLTVGSKALYLDCLLNNDTLTILVTDDKMVATKIELSQNLEELSSVSVQDDYKFTVWCANFASGNPNTILLGNTKYILHCNETGGDDCIMGVYDFREAPENFVLRMKDKVTHQAGITCFNFNSHDSNYFVSGSYDETLRLWDFRKITPRSGPIHELGLGGGVWRAKHHYDSQYIACACMHNKFQIVELEGYSTLNQVVEFGDLKSLCYGIDWRKEKELKFTVASCSFYDNLVNLWEAEPKKNV